MLEWRYVELTDDEFYLNKKIEHLVDDNGCVPDNKMKSAHICSEIAEEVASRMLGCSLCVGEKNYILTELELYYGSIGDCSHDWYRQAHIANSRGYNHRHAIDIKTSKGLRIYLNQKGQSTRRRMDIIIGNEGVAISLLVREVFDVEKSVFIRGTSLLLTELGIDDKFHNHDLINGYHVKLNVSYEKRIENSLSLRFFPIEPRLRATGKNYKGFDCKCLSRRESDETCNWAKKKWNFKLERR